MVELLGLLVSLGDPGVQEHRAVGVVDQVPADDDLLAGPDVPVVGDREVPEQDRVDVGAVDHALGTVPVSPGAADR